MAFIEIHKKMEMLQCTQKCQINLRKNVYIHIAPLTVFNKKKKKLFFSSSSNMSFRLQRQFTYQIFFLFSFSIIFNALFILFIFSLLFCFSFSSFSSLYCPLLGALKLQFISWITWTIFPLTISIDFRSFHWVLSRVQVIMNGEAHLSSFDVNLIHDFGTETTNTVKSSIIILTLRRLFGKQWDFSFQNCA